jgi:hypothetical protein
MGTKKQNARPVDAAQALPEALVAALARGEHLTNGLVAKELRKEICCRILGL